MSYLTLVGTAAPPTPATGKTTLYFDSADKRWKIKMDDGSVVVAQSYENFNNGLINGAHLFAQRQAPATLTTYSNTTGRSYAADRWGITNENASVQYKRVDTAGAFETNLTARYYGKYTKITSAGKMVISQVMAGDDITEYRGRAVRLQAKMKYSITTAMTVRLGLLQLTNAGTVDTIPATFVSAFGAVGTDPTWGTNLTALIPRQPDGGTVSGGGLTCVLTSAWARYSAVFDIPTTCKNLIAVIYTNGQPAALDELNLSECQLNDGEEIMDWSRDLYALELVKARRYYRKSFDVDTLPAQNVGLAGAAKGWTVAGAVAASFGIQFDQPMRVAPTTTTFYNPSAANAFVRNVPAGTDATATAVANASMSGIDVNNTGLAAWVAGQTVAVHYTCDAEL